MLPWKGVLTRQNVDTAGEFVDHNEEKTMESTIGLQMPISGHLTFNLIRSVASY